MEPEVKQRRDLWTALVLLGLAGLYLYKTFEFTPGGGRGLPNARTFPFILTGALVLLALILIWQSRARPGSKPAVLAEPDEEVLLVEDPSRLRLFLLVLLLLGYVVILPYAGFLIATVLFGLLLQIGIFRAGWLISSIAVVALTGLSYWLFTELLKVPLPGFSL